MITERDQMIAYALILLALGYGLTMTVLVAVGKLTDRRQRREARLRAADARRLERDLAAHLNAYVAADPELAAACDRLLTNIHNQQGEQ